MVAVYTREATNGLLLIDLVTSDWQELPLDLVDIQKNAVRRLSDTSFVVIGTSRTTPAAVYVVDIASQPIQKALIRSSMDAINLPTAIFSKAEVISFQRSRETDPSEYSHAIFVPPRNPNYKAPPGTKPPLIVSMHGGPTSHVSPGLLLTTQYWTSRGYAFVHVNYAGSTGYGRRYRDSLDGSWGLIDASDAASCVEFLAANSWVDSLRVGIVGASAGGYSVLRALIMYPTLWRGGISQYGIGDLEKLAGMMHKFEKFYIQQLLFGSRHDLGVEDMGNIYKERSPCFHAEKILAPVLFLQGTEDMVVPLSQAQEMADLMQGGGVEVKLVVFEGEGHGFRQSANLKQAIEEETLWWSKTLLTK